MKIRLYLLLFITLIITSACQQSIDYEAFVDQGQQGKNIFKEDVTICREYAKLHAGRSEGSQAAGEHFLQKQKLFSLCMEKKQWVPKP